VSFEEGLKWRFSDGDSKFYAAIADDAFLEQMDEGESFAKGDTLRIELETKQVVTQAGSIKNEHRVLKVISHVSRPQQLAFPFDNSEQPKE
jgi:hypothetical protein